MNNQIKQVLVLILLTMTCSLSMAQSASKIARITAEIEQVMKTENIPAISIGILRNGGEQVFINKGHFDRSAEKEVDEQSIFQIASLGKMFIGIVAHNLLLEEIIRLDQSITDFLPKSYSEKTLKKLSVITIEQLLHHQSGLPRDARAGYKRIDGDTYLYNYTEADFATDLKRAKIRKAGEFEYSNLGYALLAYVMEKATNESYDELLNKYVITPYGLEHTGLQLTKDEEQDLVTAYRKDKRTVATPAWFMGKLAPPTAMYTNVSDLIELMKIQLQAYKTFASSEQATPLTLSHNTVEVWKDTGIQYGYGMFSWGGDVYGHGGDMDGYGSDYSLSPQKDFGVALLTSSGGRWINPLVIKINKILGE